MRYASNFFGLLPSALVFAGIIETLNVHAAVQGPTQGLVAYWAFDEGAGTTVADSSGSGYTLSLVNGPTWTTGKLNGGLSFNGFNQYGVVPGIDLSGTAAASVSVWLNRVWTPLTSGATVLLEFSPNFNSSTTGFMFFPDNQCGGMALGLHGNNGYNINCYNQPSSGAWHHLVFIYDKSQNAVGEVSLYLDGVLQAPRSRLYGADNSNAFGANPLYLFSRGGNQLFAAGTIDELRIYNRALSAAEVGQLYGLGSGADTTPPTVTMVAPSNGATVSGTIPVSANASDDVAVVGVQFQLDGSNLGAEVTSSPYQVSWSTTGASDGPHTLSATARDGSGNSSIASISVVVSNAVPVPGLVAYWKFDEGAGATVADSSGNGYTLSLVNGPTWTTGKLNGGLSFNGLNEYGVVPGIDLSGTAAASVSLWLNRVWNPLTSAATTVLLEFSANFNSSTTGFMFFPDNQCGGMALGLHGNNGYNINCYNQPSSGAWHHLVFIYDKSQNAAGEVSLYLDGVLQAPRSRLYGADNSNAFGANPLYLFSRGGNQLFASGTIDELRVYNRALSATEVGQLYGLGPAADTTPPRVAMTAPSNGAVVSGTISVSANASDDVAVAGVQFQLDGSNLGAEVTSSPYQVLWSTTGASDGPHTLSATARDGSGNSSIASISVVVSNTVPLPGLVAYWKFDEGAGTTVADSSGNGYTLSLVNGPAWTTGKFNGGLSFNGLNEYGLVPSINLSGTAAASVSVWLNRVWTPLTSGSTVLLEFSANFNSSTTGFTIFPDDQCGGMALGLRGNNGYNLNCYNQPSSGAWHHLVFIFDKSQNAAGEVSLYLDGVLQAPRSQGYAADNSNAFGVNPLYLFARGGNQLFASGTIDELRIYSRALSAAEVGQLYSQGGSNPGQLQPAGLMARVNATNATEWVANGSPTVTIANNAIVYTGDTGASCIGYVNILGKSNNRWSMRQSGIGWIHTVPTITASSYGIALGIVPYNYENFNRSLMGQFDMTTTSIGRVHIAWGGQWGSSPTASPLSAPMSPTPQTGDLITNYFCLSNNTSIMWSSNLTRGGSTSVAVDISLGDATSTSPLDPTVGVPGIKNWCNSPVTISNIGIFSVIPKPQQYALFGASICFGYNGGAWTNTFEANITRLLSSAAQGGACRFIGTSGCMEADLTNLFWEASARGVKHVIFKDVGDNAYASWGLGASATTSNIWWAFQSATNLFGPANVVMGTPFPRLNADLTPIYNWVIRTFSGGLAANLGPDDFALLKDPGDPYLQSQYANDPGGLGHFSPLGFRVVSTNTATFLNSRYGLQ